MGFTLHNIFLTMHNYNPWIDIKEQTIIYNSPVIQPINVWRCKHNDRSNTKAFLLIVFLGFPTNPSRIWQVPVELRNEETICEHTAHLNLGCLYLCQEWQQVPCNLWHCCGAKSRYFTLQWLYLKKNHGPVGDMWESAKKVFLLKINPEYRCFEFWLGFTCHT